MKTGLVAMIVAVGSVCVNHTRAEEGGSGFHEMITQMGVARSALVSFDVTVNGQVERTNADVTPTRRLDRFEFRFALDTPNYRLFVSRVNTYKTEDDAENERRLFVDTPEWQLHSRDSQAVLYAPGAYRGSRPAFFDPRVVGLYFGSDYRRGVPAEAIFGNYLQWKDDFKRIDLGDGKIAFQRGMEARGNVGQAMSLVVDTSRDYWPVELMFFVGDKTELESTTELEKWKELWLPARTVVSFAGETTRLEFKWNSVNEPVSDDLFSQKKIGQTHRLKVIRHSSLASGE